MLPWPTGCARNHGGPLPVAARAHAEACTASCIFFLALAGIALLLAPVGFLKGANPVVSITAGAPRADGTRASSRVKITLNAAGARARIDVPIVLVIPTGLAHPVGAGRAVGCPLLRPRALRAGRAGVFAGPGKLSRRARLTRISRRTQHHDAACITLRALLVHGGGTPDPPLAAGRGAGRAGRTGGLRVHHVLIPVLARWTVPALHVGRAPARDRHLLAHPAGPAVGADMVGRLGAICLEVLVLAAACSATLPAWTIGGYRALTVKSRRAD